MKPNQLQIAIRVGEIPPDNDENVWGDYSKLIIVYARITSEGESAPGSSPGFLMFGQKEGKAFIKPITEEDALKQMRHAFIANSRFANVNIDEPQEGISDAAREMIVENQRLKAEAQRWKESALALCSVISDSMPEIESCVNVSVHEGKALKDELWLLKLRAAVKSRRGNLSPRG